MTWKYERMADAMFLVYCPDDGTRTVCKAYTERGAKEIVDALNALNAGTESLDEDDYHSGDIHNDRTGFDGK